MNLNKNTDAIIIALIVIIIVIIFGYLVLLKGRYYKLTGGYVYDKWTDRIFIPKK